MRIRHFIIIGLAALLSSAAAVAQTLYVPSGTGGIGSASTSNKIGISNSAPADKLDIQVANDANVSEGLIVERAAGATAFGFKLKSDGSGNYRGAITAKGNSLSEVEAITISADNYSGYVGIGTTAPSVRLEVYAPSAEGIRIRGDGSYLSLFNTAGTRQGYLQGSSGNVVLASDSGVLAFNANGSERVRIDTTGNVGIGTSSPGARLEVNGGGILVKPTTSSYGYVGINPGGSGYAGYVEWYKNGPTRLGYIGYMDLGGNQGNLGLNLENSANFIIGGGNVGIGTASPTQKLSVNGTIRAKEVIVDTGWSDYVFDSNYRLAPLGEVEAHIKAEKHLPGIPSAAEVSAHGVSMGEMQSKLLAKIEELTLHVIAQGKAVSELRDENTALKQRFSRLETVTTK